MKLNELAKDLNISTESFMKFIQDFDLELSECMSTQMEVKPDFERFARENADFLKRYQADLDHSKSVSDIAQTINQPEEKVEEIIKKEKPKLYDNGIFRSSVSSFGIDNKLGGNYKFVYDYFGKKSGLKERDFIGYRDLFFYISRSLEPFINKEQTLNWGIHKPAGIILYGPPGSGKIFWANKIAEIIGYTFTEVKKHYLGTSFVDGRQTSFNDFLIQMMKDEKVLLFMDDFDQIMRQRSEKVSVNSCDEATKEIILHSVSRFEEEDLLMIGSANSLALIDKEVMAPGRFDVLIPIFPPNASERSEMILYHMTANLPEDSLLLKILRNNKADHRPFWTEVASQMKVFSNTMIVDFTQSLKIRIRNQYLKDSNESMKLDNKLLNSALRDARVKLTDEYLDRIEQFIIDVSNTNFDDFPTRVRELSKELNSYKIVEKPRKTIGFTHNTDDPKK
ncbi:AAA family ATPase [Chryseobacterium sp. cx-311]|uniref:AAA family ATPase n=1 Tax=Marnyiella aurantia TaxID=2758037 RepID=UPI001AE6826B|nr:AAA family ATPase [Marnyiella aurantia]MBP0613042.1 AAA family ATPase [Marnyiella aurantia]